jgi:hypothetical protein
MYSDVIYSIAIGFGGAILFLLVDKYEKDNKVVASLLKFDPARACVKGAGHDWRARRRQDHGQHPLSLECWQFWRAAFRLPAAIPRAQPVSLAVSLC